MKKSFLFFLFAFIALSCNPASQPGEDGTSGSPTDPPVAPPTAEAKTPGMNMFYKGGTMSFASYLQDLGLVYREGNKQKDPYQSMAEHGANCVRLQLDQIAFAKMGNTTIDWQSYKRVLADSKKAKAQGLEIFLTLKPDYDIYTDELTHHNILPPAWKGKTESQIGEAIYEWVTKSLEDLAAEGIYPAIVAVGNEVNIGFMRPDGSSPADNARTGRLLSYGHRAVRDYAAKHNPACISALHIADPGKVQGSVSVMESAGAKDYDLIAISYYPGKDIGHSLPGNDFSTIARMFPKRKIMVVETAYSFTTGSIDGKWMGDWCSNAYNYPDWDDATNSLNYTPAKCRAWLASLASQVKAAGGIGLVTWGTESLPDLLSGKEEGHGLGLYTYPATWAYGSTWENNSYWDFTDNNNLHEGIDWMKDIK